MWRKGKSWSVTKNPKTWHHTFERGREVLSNSSVLTTYIWREQWVHDQMWKSKNFWTGTEITGVRLKEEVSDSENRSGATTNPPGKQTLSQMTFIHRESRLQISPCKPTVYITNDPLQHLLILLLENGTLASGISLRLIHDHFLFVYFVTFESKPNRGVCSTNALIFGKSGPSPSAS